VGRKLKKRNMRRLRQIKINAAIRQFSKNGLNYSKFIHRLKEAKIELDRKILAEIAENYSKIFKRILKIISESK